MPVRIRLYGNTDAAKSLLPTARKLLGDLKNRMAFNALKQDQQTMNMADGTVFKVKRVFGQDTIDIVVPAVEVVEEEVKEEISIPTKYKIRITNIKTQEIVDTSCLMRMTVYSKEATALEEEQYIFFDYKVPTDLDDDGNLLIEPEEYFGSEDNPGLNWDDDNECFVIETRFINNTMLSLLTYPEALGAGELKHFLVYGCKDCILDKYKEARENQQYPEIVDDDERWQEEHLVELGLGEEILEDNMSCVIQSFMVAYLGTHKVVWDAITGGYAQGIIDDNGDEILDADWPVHRNDLNDFEALTSSMGTASAWGTELNPYLWFTQNPDYNAGSCEESVQSHEQDNRYIPAIPGGLKDWWEYTVVDCDDDWPPIWYGYSIDITYLNGWKSDYTFRSVSGIVNGFTVYIHTLYEREYRTDFDISGSPVITVGNEETSKFATVVTPWGTLFDRDWFWYYDYHSTKVGSIVTNCTGEYWSENADNDAEDKMKTYHYKSDNIIFFCSFVTYFIDKYNLTILSQTCSVDYGGGVVDTKNGIDSVGTIGYYTEDKCNKIDPNTVRDCPDIKEGMNNLAQTYYDVFWGDGKVRLISPLFRHREGAI